MDPVRTLTIKTKVCQRIAREIKGYKEEATRESARADAYEAEGRDEYDVAKQRAVAAESQMMIGDCVKRLRDAVDDLTEVVESDPVDPESSEEAATALANAKGALETYADVLKEFDDEE